MADEPNLELLFADAIEQVRAQGCDCDPHLEPVISDPDDPEVWIIVIEHEPDCPLAT